MIVPPSESVPALRLKSVVTVNVPERLRVAFASVMLSVPTVKDSPPAIDTVYVAALARFATTVVLLGTPADQSDETLQSADPPIQLVVVMAHPPCQARAHR